MSRLVLTLLMNKCTLYLGLDFPEPTKSRFINANGNNGLDDNMDNGSWPLFILSSIVIDCLFKFLLEPANHNISLKS